MSVGVLRSEMMKCIVACGLCEWRRTRYLTAKLENVDIQNVISNMSVKLNFNTVCVDLQRRRAPVYLIALFWLYFNAD